MFKPKDKDEEFFTESYVKKLQLHISKVIMEMNKNPASKFNLREKFAVPISSKNDFIDTLNAEPFLCSKLHSISILDALAELYKTGENRINT